MAKELRDKPAKGKLEKEVEKLSGRDKERKKAELLRDHKPEDSFNYKGVDITITSPPVVVGDRLEVSVSATRNGKVIPIDNPLIFINPPIKVPDGTVHIEQNIDGVDIEVDNYKEDPQEALKEIVYQVIQLQEKK